MSSQSDLDENLAKASARIAEAASRGAEAVFLPENFAFFGPEDKKREVAEELDGKGPIFHALSDAASRGNVVVVAGGMPERSADPQRPYNTCAVFGKDGTLVAKYRKI